MICREGKNRGDGKRIRNVFKNGIRIKIKIDR